MASNKTALIEKLGSEQAYREWLLNNARKGAKWKGRKGFAAMPKREAKKIHSMGGKASAEKRRNEH